ncbi:hypothetical protein BsWGS_19046 [Bradybaena similaris]
MADNKNPADLEGEPYTTIEFKVVRCGAVQNTHQIDCDLAGPSIIGLKEDLAELFQVPAEKQQWYFNSVLLNDVETLLKAGIKSREELTEITVVAA